MITRTREIVHPMGVKLQTPFLIPSFSSKGKRMWKDKSGKLTSELQDIIENAVLTDYYLISAYDLYHRFLTEKERLPRTNLIFIDSGGYEVSETVDGNNELEHIYLIQSWDYNKFNSVHSEWNDWLKKSLLPAVIISYDNPKEERLSLEKQIERALELKKNFPGQLYDILLKPENIEDNNCDVIIHNRILPNIDKLAEFDIIGLTEKELGNSIEARITNIKFLRNLLDKSGVDKPIHVFGGLDPTLSLLYFMAGAEIFDGLSWYRYQYDSGVATYHYNFNLDYETMFEQEEKIIKGLMMVNNLSKLNALEIKMRGLTENVPDHFEYMKDVYGKLASLI